MVGGQGLLAVDTKAGRAKVGPILGAPSCVHFTCTLSFELHLRPGIECCRYLNVNLVYMHTYFQDDFWCFTLCFTSIADSGAPVCEMGTLPVRQSLKNSVVPLTMFLQHHLLFTYQRISLGLKLKNVLICFAQCVVNAIFFTTVVLAFYRS